MSSNGRITTGAVLLAVAIVGVSLTWSTNVAAGSDAYGYVSQADLWLKRDLFIDQSFAADAPWPMARWTFTPLGYRPEVDGFRIVPAYAPGLPLLMAAAKQFAGQCAVFWIVPLAAGVLVLATYAIGYATGGSLVGLGAAWLVATSPTLLFMAMAPMSDVPAAAAWAVAVAAAMNGGAAAAVVGGVAASIAILIRPNLAPIAAVVCIAWAFRSGWRRATVYVAIAGAGATAVAVINARLYGSPLVSGYDLTDAFSFANVIPNLGRYGWWLMTIETPLAIAGLAWLVWSRRWLLAAVVAVVWGLYLIYVPWDAWWYLRFLLPSWPMMAVGTALLLFRTAAMVPRGSLVAAAVLVFVGLLGVLQAWERDAFNQAAGESKYVEVARVVDSLTGPEDVIISAQHSGTLRYYAGRLTMRWDTGDLAWLDRSVEWLRARGHNTYLLLEAPEIDGLRAKAGGVSEIARVDWSPMVSFRGGSVKLFDATNRMRDVPAVENKASFTVDACATAKPLPRMVLR